MNNELGVAAVEVTTTADRLLLRGTRASENGELIAMSVVVTEGTPEVGQCWVEAGIMKGGVGDAFKAAIIVQGYTTFNSAEPWLGNVPLDAGDLIYLEARGAEVYILRLNALVRMEGM